MKKLTNQEVSKVINVGQWWNNVLASYYHELKIQIYFLRVLEVRSLNWAGSVVCLLESLQELLEATGIPWLITPQSLFKTSYVALSGIFPLWPLHLLSPPLLWVILLQRPLWLIISRLKIFNLIMNAKSLLLCKVVYLQILSIWGGGQGGGRILFCLPQITTKKFKPH